MRLALQDIYSCRSKDVTGVLAAGMNWLPRAGICFGRSIRQCYWFGVDRTRWARTTHALRMGREYTEPFEGLGTTDKAEISGLCWFMCCLGERTPVLSWLQVHRGGHHQLQGRLSICKPPKMR